MRIAKLITGPAEEPVSVATAKSQVRFDLTTEDTLIGVYLAAAREYLELITDRRFVEQTWDVYLPRFPRCSEIILPFGTLVSVDAFAWTDSAGTGHSWTVSGTNLISGSTTIATVDIIRDPGRIALAYAQSWPSDTLATTNPVRVRITCGWSDAAAVPAGIRHAITLLAAHWFEHRVPVALGNPSAIDAKEIPYTIQALIAPWRLHN